MIEGAELMLRDGDGAGEDGIAMACVRSCGVEISVKMFVSWHFSISQMLLFCVVYINVVIRCWLVDAVGTMFIGVPWDSNGTEGGGGGCMRDINAGY